MQSQNKYVMRNHRMGNKNLDRICEAAAVELGRTLSKDEAILRADYDPHPARDHLATPEGEGGDQIGPHRIGPPAKPRRN